MPFPLGSVLSAAPSVISAAADIIRVLKENKFRQTQLPDTTPVESEKMAELKGLIDQLEDVVERQAQVIENLAENNRNLALAAKNNRILSVVSLAIAICAVILSVALWKGMPLPTG